MVKDFYTLVTRNKKVTPEKKKKKKKRKRIWLVSKHSDVSDKGKEHFGCKKGSEYQ